MSTPISPVPDLSQYNYEIGDTTSVVLKQNAINAEIDTLVPKINTAITGINQDVDDVNAAAANLNVEQIVHAPGSGLLNAAGSAVYNNTGDFEAAGSSQQAVTDHAASADHDDR
jgi:hypothetical protein